MTLTAHVVKMPQLGETVTEGTITRWLKNVGDTVAKYEAFAEVATDKVNAEIPSPVSGRITEIFVAEGETVPTGAPIISIETAATANKAPAAPASAEPAAAAQVSAPAANGRGAGGARLPLSPAVRRALREHGLDPHTIHGTGHDGRITLADVHGAAAASAERSVQRIAVSRARRTIAEHMTHAVRTIPHAWTMIEVDVSALVAKRRHERESYLAREGFAPTYFQYFSYAVVRTLARHPYMNSRYGEDAIEMYGHVDLSFAIALNGNLVVPVIANAQALTFGEFAKAMTGVTERARLGRLSIDELGSGTITVNNTGANGSMLSQPIINNGQAAIVTMEAIVKRPVVVDNDAIAIRSMLNVCCTIDHRVVDGDVVGAFLRDLKQLLSSAA